MNKILMPMAAALILSSPLALASTSTASPNSGLLPTVHCENLPQDIDHAKFKSKSARELAEQQAQSLCRQNKDGGDKHEGMSGNEGSRGSHSARG